MAELKTTPTENSVQAFLASVEDDQKRKDCDTLIKVMSSITQAQPKMWGESIVGFGNYHYRYASGREGDWFQVGFSPRKQNLTVYIMCGFDKHQDIMEKLGKYKTGSSCLYLKKLEDIDLKVLRELMEQSIHYLKEKYPDN